MERLFSLIIYLFYLRLVFLIVICHKENPLNIEFHIWLKSPWNLIILNRQIKYISFENPLVMIWLGRIFFYPSVCIFFYLANRLQTKQVWQFFQNKYVKIKWKFKGISFSMFVSRWFLVPTNFIVLFAFFV